MVDALQDFTAAYSKPIDVSGLAGNFQQGIQSGVDIAQRQAQMQMMQAELGFKRDQLQTQKYEHVTGLLDKALSTYRQDPSMGQAQLQQIQKIGSNLNVPISDDFVDLMHKSQMARDQWAVAAAGRDNLDPDQRKQSIKEAAQAGVGTSEALEYLNKATQQAAKQKETETTANALLGRPVVQGEQERKNQSLKDALRAPIPADLRARLSIGDMSALAEAAPYVTAFAQKQAETSQGLKEAQTTHLGTQDQASKQRVALTQQQLALNGKRLDLTSAGKLTQLDQQIETNPVYKGIKNSQALLNDIGNVLRPGMKWADVSIVNKDMIRALTGAGRPAFGAEQDLSFKDYSKFFTDQFGKVTGEEAGGPTNAQIAVLQDRVNRISSKLADTGAAYQKGLWKGRVNSAKAAGLNFPSEEMAKAHWEANNQGKEWDEGVLPGAPRGQMGAPSPGGVQGISGPSTSGKTPSAAFLRALSSKIPDPTARSQWLKSNGWIAPGGP